MILLYHETGGGSIATSSHPVAGEHHLPRRYQHTGHFVELDGPPHIVAHDAEEICKIEGYRMATSEELSSYLEKKRGTGKIHEEVADPKSTGGRK
jgi:hypothetical protein